MTENVRNVSAGEKIRDHARKEFKEDRLQRREMVLKRARKNLRQTEDEMKAFNVMTCEEFETAVSKIKQGNQTSHLHLRAVRQALNESKKVSAFLKITGALHAVVGHLTGRKALHQLEAAYVCCNLSTSSAHSCEIVTNAAGPYLIQYLDSQNIDLQVACLWTLGNLSAGSPKSLSTLQSQGFIPRLIACLKSSHMEVVEATLETLCVVCKSSVNEVWSCPFSSNERREVAQIVLHLKCCRELILWVVYLLSCFPDCDEIFIENTVPQKCIEELANLIQHDRVSSAIRSTTALVRAAANFASGINGLAAIAILKHQALPAVVTELLQSDHSHLHNECKWFISNLLNHPCDEVVLMAKEQKLDEIFS